MIPEYVIRPRALCRVCGERVDKGRHSGGWRHSKPKHRDHRVVIGYVWPLPPRRRRRAVRRITVAGM
jgi:hypothetical protein